MEAATENAELLAAALTGAAALNVLHRPSHKNVSVSPSGVYRMRKERKTNATAGAERPDQKLMDGADEGTERDLMPPLCYSIKEVCRLTGLGKTTIYKQIKKGALIAGKVDGRTIVTHENLVRFLRNCERCSVPQERPLDSPVHP
jgi:excisionase family DNA binding protein